MAELVLMIGAHPAYEDGDVLCAFNDRRIAEVHCAHICSPRKRPDLSPRGRGGLLVPGTLAEDLLARSHRYRFERVSEREVRRVDLDSLDEAIFSDKPAEVDGKWQAIDVPLFVARRLRDENHKLFGDEGAEYWYGGERTPEKSALDSVWDRIEAEAGLLKADHTLWPLSEVEKKRFLPIAFEEHDDEQSGLLTAPLYDIDPEDMMIDLETGEPVGGRTPTTTPVVLKKRAVKLDWKAHFGERPEIVDKEQTADLRAEAAKAMGDLETKAKA